jgi:hypothetical protein
MRRAIEQRRLEGEHGISRKRAFGHALRQRFLDRGHERRRHRATRGSVLEHETR